MAKFALKANPTFPAKVGIAVAGQATDAEVVLTYKHRTKTELEEYVKARVGQTDAQAFMDMVVGWDIDEPFTAENVAILLEHRIGFGLAAFMKYLDELSKVKTKN